MDAVERVALLLKAKLAEQLDATPLHQPGDWAANGGEINLTDLSRAAIAAVLDSMAEPSEAAIRAGAHGSRDPNGVARGAWTAMLAAMRAEMLGATPPADPE